MMSMLSKVFKGTACMMLILLQPTRIGAYSPVSEARADIVAPMPPPELSDTLVEFRTRQQMLEKTHIHGRIDESGSLEIPTRLADRESGVLRMTHNYQGLMEVAVPKYGVSLMRFYDQSGRPLEILSYRIDGPDFVTERTPATHELSLRQYQGAEKTHCRVRLRRVDRPVSILLNPVLLVNQQKAVHTLVSVIRVNTPNTAPRKSGRGGAQIFERETAPLLPQFAALSQKEISDGLKEAVSLVFPMTQQDRARAEDALRELEEDAASSGLPLFDPSAR